MNAIHFNEDDNGINPTVGEIPAELLSDAAEAHRHELVEAAAEYDDELLEKFLNDEELSVEEIKKALRAATIDCAITPVTCGASFKNKGVQSLLDAILDFLPSPLDVPPIKGLDVEDRRRGRASLRPRCTVRRTGVQGHDRSVRGQAHVLPCLLGHAGRRLLHPQLDQGPQGAHRSPSRDARELPRGRRAGLGRRHRRRRRSEELHDGRHALRRGCSGAPRVDGLPRPGHRHRDRAQDQGRPGEARAVSCQACRRGPDVPCPHGPRDRPDDHRRHGRAASRGHRRPSAARVQGGGQRRQAAGRLPRDRQAAGLTMSKASSYARPAVAVSTVT